MYIFQYGCYIPGVPARDLTDDEAKAYGVRESPAYVHDMFDGVGVLDDPPEPVRPEDDPDITGVIDDEDRELEQEVQDNVDSN